MSSTEKRTCKQALEQRVIRPEVVAFIATRMGLPEFNIPDFFERKDLRGFLSTRFLSAYGQVNRCCEQVAIGENKPVLTFHDFFDISHPAGQITLGAHEIVARLSGISMCNHEWFIHTADMLNVLYGLEQPVTPLIHAIGTVCIARAGAACDNVEMVQSLAGLVRLSEYVALQYGNELKSLHHVRESDRKRKLVKLAHALVRLHTQLTFTAGLLSKQDPVKAGDRLFLQTLRYCLSQANIGVSGWQVVNLSATVESYEKASAS